jgi:hypothetical protein
MRYICGIGYLAIVGYSYPPDILLSAVWIGIIYSLYDSFRAEKQ